MPRAPQPPASPAPRRRSRSSAAAERAAAALAQAQADEALLAAAADGDEGDEAAAAQAAQLAAAAASRRVADREFLPMVLLGAATPPSRTALGVALLLLLSVLGATGVRGAGMNAGVKSPKQLSASSSRRASSGGVPPAPGSPPQPPDVALPPMLLLMSLHGDKDKPSDADNALRRYRLSGARSAYGRARLRLDELSPVAFAEMGDDDDVAGRRALLYPRGMALLPGGRLAVASAAGGDGGAVRVASAAAVCAAGGGLMPAPPPPPPPPPPRAPGPASAAAASNNIKDNIKAAKAPRVPSAVLCAPGLDHPYGIAAARQTLLVTNQGSGVVSACALEPTAKQQQAGPATAAAAAFFVRHGAGRAAAEPLPADADDDAEDGDVAAAPSSDQIAAASAASASSSQSGGGDASSPLRGVAVDPASGRVYVAAKGYHSVFEHAANGTLLGAIPVSQPIALLWDASRNGLFIGSDAKSTVRVLFWDATSRGVVATLAHRDGRGHAAGMALAGTGALLVLGQGAGALYQFDLASGQLAATLATGLPRPEALLLYSGPCSAPQ